MEKLEEGIGDSVRPKNKCESQEERSVTKLDRIRSEIIRGTTKVGEISKKVQESMLKWYGHVLRREDEYVGKRVMAIEVPGKEGEDDQSGGGWIASGTTCRRENYQGRTRKTGLNGGVS